MELITERMPLGDLNATLADRIAKDTDRKPSDVEFIRKGYVAKTAEPDDEERSTTELISTGDVDRDKEILLPKGADLTHYKANPQVLWAHNYSTPPIGRAAWVKKKAEGLLAKTIYATTSFAEEIWQLVRGGFLPARSVGFIPLESHEPDEKEIRKYPERADARRIIDKWELLEYSVVPVPSNRQALQQAMAKGLNLSEDTQEALGINLTDLRDFTGTGEWELEDEETKEPERKVRVYRKIEDTGRYVRETGKRINVVKVPDLALDVQKRIRYKVLNELRRKRGRIT